MALAFDCGARAHFLGPDGTRAAVDRLILRAAGVAFSGFFTYGEIARTRGARGMRHLTLGLVAFA